jgi:hypothetical protein
MKTNRHLRGNLIFAILMFALPSCDQRDAIKSRAQARPDATHVQAVGDLAPMREVRGEIWPVPAAATSMGDHMWAVTLVHSASERHPQLHSRTVMAYQTTAYDRSRKVLSGPATRIASVDYFEPRWQRIYLQMAVGDVRRVWVIDPREPVVIYDVELKNLLAVQ